MKFIASAYCFSGWHSLVHSIVATHPGFSKSRVNDKSSQLWKVAVTATWWYISVTEKAPPIISRKLVQIKSSASSGFFVLFCFVVFLRWFIFIFFLHHQWKTTLIWDLLTNNPKRVPERSGEGYFLVNLALDEEKRWRLPLDMVPGSVKTLNKELFKNIRVKTKTQYWKS